jgi:hypothetical protein
LITTDPDRPATYCPDCGGCCGDLGLAGCQCVDCPTCLDLLEGAPRPGGPVLVDHPSGEPYHTTINVGGEVL